MTKRCQTYRVLETESRGRNLRRAVGYGSLNLTPCAGSPAQPAAPRAPQPTVDATPGGALSSRLDS